MCQVALRGIVATAWAPPTHRVVRGARMRERNAHWATMHRLRFRLIRWLMTEWEWEAFMLLCKRGVELWDEAAKRVRAPEQRLH